MRKLALLLTLCLVVTMLPGVGYSEDEPDLGLEVEQPLPQEELLLELPEEEQDEAGLIDGDLLLDLDALSDSLLIVEDPGEITLPSEDGNAQDPAAPSDPSGENPAEAGATPYIDPEGPKLAANTLTLGIEDFFYLDSTMPGGGQSAYTYISSDSAIAKVYKSSRVTGVSEGFACITAVDQDGRYSECYVYVKKAPEKIDFGMDSLVLGVGEYYRQLNLAFGEPAGEYAGTYTIESENTHVLKVRKNNVLKGAKVGEARLKVTTYNGLKDTLDVTVKKAPGKVTLSVDKTTLGVGETGKASYKLPKNTAGAVTLTSSNPDVVSVDGDTGKLVALAAGTAVIRAETYNGKTSDVTVEVLPAPQSVSFDSSTLKLAVGMSLKPAASVNEGAAGAISYSVKDKGIADYSGGTLTGVKAGKTVLTAKAYNGVSAKCTVEVVAAPTSVKLPYKELEIGVGQSVRLEPDVGDSASTFTYKSSSPKVAKVAGDGTLTGVKKGSATVTVTTFNGKKFKLKVKVVKAPASVSLTPESVELMAGETAYLKWSFPKGSAAAVSFESSDPAIAEVDPATGAVKGVSGGRAVITVTTTNGKTDQCEVTVTALPEWIRFTEDQVEIGASQAHQLEVELNPGAASSLRFESADGKVATVSDSGVVTGVAEGETVVTVYTSAEGVTAQVPVTVRPAPKSVKFSPATMTLSVGDTALLVPVITKGSVTGFTYGSSVPEVASVSEDGTLTALSRGEATVTVTTSNGLSADLRLTVTDPLYPESAKLTNAPSSMKEGETLQLKWKVEPAGAAVDFTWASSDANVAYADDAGMLYAVSMGYATITATSRRNTDIVLSFQVGVDGKNVVLTLPARITGTSAIQKNLDRIDAIRTAGIGQIDALLANGQITEADASRRRQIVNNVFKDYAFPWMTEEKQLYWKKENSQNGAKDFKKGKIYYGVPYTQDHRGFNVEKLMKQNYYTDSGKGYAVLNRNKIKSRDYRGSDCSSFVGAAIWGVSDSRGNDRTYEIMKSSDYKTIKGFENLRTGDLVCKGHEHVIMFLYFVNAEKTKMMIIQNGGNEHGSNTVNCMIMDVKYYTSRGYKVRRLKRLG